MKALALVALVACGHGPQRVGNEPSWRHGSAGSGSATAVVVPQTFAPTTEAARNYNEPPQPAPKTPLGDAIVAAVDDAAAKLHLPPPVADARLFRACGELAEILPDEGDIDPAVLDFIVHRAGIIEPTPLVRALSGDAHDEAKIVSQIRPALADMLQHGGIPHVGVGVVKHASDDGITIVVGVTFARFTTKPIPRSLSAGASFVIDGVVDPHYHDAQAFVTRPNGDTEQLRVETGTAGALKVRIACENARGPQQIEVAASDVHGDDVLANFPVWCGEEPPRSIPIGPPTIDDKAFTADQAAHSLFELINADRTKAGLPTLAWDERVATVARKYSEEMRKTQIIAHVSSTSGSIEDRLRAAHITAAMMAENIAHSLGVSAAHAGLMNSPGHRANILSTHATHAGIGVALGDVSGPHPELYVTEDFIRIPPKIDVAQTVEVVQQRIAKVRQVAFDPRLANIAGQVAVALASGKSRDAVWPTAKKQLDGLATEYARVSSKITAVAELESVDGKELLGNYKPDDIGVGIAQGRHPEIGEGAIWIVVLFAERPRK